MRIFLGMLVVGDVVGRSDVDGATVIVGRSDVHSECPSNSVGVQLLSVHMSKHRSKHRSKHMSKHVS